MEKREIAFNKTIQASAVGYVVEDTTSAVDGNGNKIGHLTLAAEIDGGNAVNLTTIPAKDITGSQTL